MQPALLEVCQEDRSKAHKATLVDVLRNSFRGRDQVVWPAVCTWTVTSVSCRKLIRCEGKRHMDACKRCVYNKASVEIVPRQAV